MADVQVSVLIYLLRLLNFPLPIPENVRNVGTLVGILTAFLTSKDLANDISLNPNPSLGSTPQAYDFIVGKLVIILIWKTAIGAQLHNKHTLKLNRMFQNGRNHIISYNLYIGIYTYFNLNK
jgi:hypothetical protein